MKYRHLIGKYIQFFVMIAKIGWVVFLQIKKTRSFC
jgi:hypothetical protein